MRDCPYRCGGDLRCNICHPDDCVCCGCLGVSECYLDNCHWCGDEDKHEEEE